MRRRVMLARTRAIFCNECLRPIRWWNRRVALDGSKRWLHQDCWNGQLFFKALVANEIRCAKLASGKIPDSQPVADEVKTLPILLSDAIDTGSISGELQEQAVDCPERLQELAPPENRVEASADQIESHGDSALHRFGQHL